MEEGTSNPFNNVREAFVKIFYGNDFSELIILSDRHTCGRTKKVIYATLKKRK